MAADSQPAPSKPRNLITRVILFGVLLVGIVIVASVVSFAVWRWRLRREINLRIAAIHAAGLPVNWEELAKWPSQVPDSENAALIYTNAIAHLHADGVSDDYRFELPPRGEALPDEMRSAVSGAVRTNRVALEIACTAVELRRSRYPVEYLEGPNAKLPHLAGLKQLVKLLSCEAVLKADAGDARGAAKAIETSLDTAQSLDNEPILISQLTAASLFTMSCQSLERVLCRSPLDDETLGKIGQHLISAEATNRFVMGLIGERALDGEFIRLAQDDVRRMITIANQGSSDEEKAELPSRNPGIGWRFLGFFERDRNFFLRGMETNILIVAAKPPASLFLTNETDKLETQARKGFYICSSLFLPGVSRIAVRDASTRASLNTAISAVAVERWRLTHHGAIPDLLKDLVPSFLPAVPIDPFDGQPLRFKRLPTGYVIYSIGADRQDDGGKERPPRSVQIPRDQRNHFDITFTVER
jgi:hypothetical protein